VEDGKPATKNSQEVPFGPGGGGAPRLVFFLNYL
jgi:hypothetical protein